MDKYFIKAARNKLWKRYRLAKLPDHYYKFRRSLELESSVGYEEKVDTQLLDYKLTDKKSLRIERIPKPKIDVIHPKEADEGLWGGEGFVRSFEKPKRWLYVLLNLLYPRLHVPKLWRTIFYSEILDRYFKLIITPSVKDAIVEAKGFDNYILRTPVQDLKSNLAFSLRRKMLLKLANKDYYPNDPFKHNLIFEKYKDCIIPLEEADWFGLSLEQALTKQFVEDMNKKKYEPLKIKFSKELIDNLKELKSSEISKEQIQKSVKDKLFDNLLPLFSSNKHKKEV